MSHPLRLSVLWHMHQPDYRDESGVMGMPWVFLHAIKDYYDMPWMLARYPGLKATFNLTPPLIEQLRLCGEPLHHDRFLQLWHRHPSELGSSERQWVIKLCKSCNYDTMIRPLDRFETLYHLTVLDDAQMLELEVLFLLSWCGFYLRNHDDVVRSLLHRGGGYNQEDKDRLLQTLSAFTQKILPFYGALLAQGVISLSTTPFNHPILPLLVDMQNAKRANPHTNTPSSPVSLREDAVLQVEKAKALFVECFGREPTGFWPAEGAVDEATLAIYRNLDIRWVATDEAILFKSLGTSERSKLYRPYRYEGVGIAFRDHGLSDLIGFDYRFKPAEEASEHFMGALGRIAAHEKDATVFVILDGENAWEYYPDNAFGFFEALYSKLQSSAWCQSVTMDEVMQGTLTPLERLAPGSWIGGDFSTWVGHSEKTRGWELLYQTRRDYETRGEVFDDETEAAVREHFLAAECSDWFWWYGDDHNTEFAAEFDELFRKHLISIYRLIRMHPPADLLEPIIEHKSTASFMVAPQSPIRPKIDGSSDLFFEWIGSGVIDETRLFSTMDKVRGPVEKIRYGQDEFGTLYIALEGEVQALEASLRIVIEECGERMDIPLEGRFETSNVRLYAGSAIEIAIQHSVFESCDRVHLRFEIEKEGEIIQTLPGFGALEIAPKEDYGHHWFV